MGFFKRQKSSIKIRLFIAFLLVIAVSIGLTMFNVSINFCDQARLSCPNLTDPVVSGAYYQKYLTVVQNNIILSVVILLSLIVLMVYFLVRRIIDPISSLSKAVKNLEKGDYDFKLSAPTNDELGDLMRAFNHMAETMKNQEKIKYEFITSASHQFRTPLSELSLQTSELSSKMKKIPKAKNLMPILEAIENASTKTSVMINDLFKVLELGEKYNAINLKLIDVNELLLKIINSFNDRIAKNKLDLTVDIQKNLKINVNEGSIKTAFINLIDNAMTYSKVGGKIEIKANAKQGQVLFEVKDAGIGIPQSEQVYIFDKFYRAKNAYSAKNVGTGLGLAIVKNIIEGHKGRIMFESRENNGTTFYFSLPE
ncbi:MAG: HAMP domain-containing sensor histidine kinase [Candidatus Falkowbacteria bacterium]|nr:HAMP domain-containing sensor histidine kinase [Candidatus Falkowbacteria bacterium]